MRLKPTEVAGILKGLDELPELKIPYDVFLFGSRTDDAKLGGDIDLLIVVLEKDFNTVAAVKHKLTAQAQKYIDEQRVDITIRARETLSGDSFYNSIKDELIRLKPSSSR